MYIWISWEYYISIVYSQHLQETGASDSSATMEEMQQQVGWVGKTQMLPINIAMNWGKHVTLSLC